LALSQIPDDQFDRNSRASSVLTLFRQAVEDKTDEITAAHEMLSGLVLAGLVITIDALATQREVAQAIMVSGQRWQVIR
jgi:hypothetical protein